MSALSNLKNEQFSLEGDLHKDHVCLLLHGLGGGAYEMRPLADILHQRGFTVEGVIYPGHSHDQPNMPDSQWTDWYDHIIQTYDHLASKYSTISLIGFSTGCPLSLKLALERKINKLILLSPFIFLKRNWYYFFPLEIYIKLFWPIVKQVPRKLTNLYDQEMRSLVSEVLKFKTFNLKAVNSAMELIQQIKPQISKLTRPTLIIQSLKDKVVDPMGATFLANKIKSKLIWLTKSHHTILLDQERDFIADEIHSFLTKTEEAL